MSEWQENKGEEGRVAWARFADFVVEARRFDEEQDLPAGWSVLDSQGETEFASGYVLGDPSLDELKRIAVAGAREWLQGLMAQLPEE